MKQFLEDMFLYVGCFKFGITTIIAFTVALVMLQWRNRQKRGVLAFDAQFLKLYVQTRIIVLILLGSNISMYLLWYIFFERRILAKEYATKIFTRGSYTPWFGPNLNQNTNNSGEITFFFNFFYILAGLLVYGIGGILDASLSTFANTTVPRFFWEHILN